MPLRPGDKALIQQLNVAIADGTVLNHGGQAVACTMNEVLVREDGDVLYPIRDGIPCLLIDEGISLKQL